MKPLTNFGVFHNNLITRLQSLSQIQLDFDKRVKDAESQYSEKFNWWTCGSSLTTAGSS